MTGHLTAKDDNHHFTGVLGHVPEDLSAEVAEFWLDQGALADQGQAQQRATELAWVAHSVQGRLDAVCTVVSMPYGADQQPHWNVRAFTRADLREAGLAVALVGLARKSLARSHRPDDPEQGLLIIAQNPVLLTPRGQQAFRHWGWALQGRTAQGFDVWRLGWADVDFDISVRGITLGPEWAA